MACLALSVTACGEPAIVTVQPAPGCGVDGELVAEIYGGFRASIHWGAVDLQCEGMPRPDGEGARLRFSGLAGDAPGERQIAFIIGLPGLVRGETPSELPANVTVIEEGAGRFFSTRSAPTCWTDIETHEKLPLAESSVYRISGILYCVAPLADLGGKSSISFADLQFSGRLNWETP